MVTPQYPPLAPNVRNLAESLVKARSAECFWFRHPEAAIENQNDVELVIQRLRENGGKQGWREAAKLRQCL